MCHPHDVQDVLVIVISALWMQLVGAHCNIDVMHALYIVIRHQVLVAAVS